MNKQLNLKIAGFSIEITAEKDEYLKMLENFYEGFLGDEIEPDFSIKIEDRSVIKTVPTTKYVTLIKKKNHYTAVNKNRKSYIVGDIFPGEKRGSYYNRYNQLIIPFFDSLLKSCVQLLLEKKRGVFLHASAVNLKGKGYVFSGPSTAGKTTIVNMKKGLNILSEEYVTVCKHNGFYAIFETPWCGRHNKHAKLDKIFFLKKDKRLKFQRLNKAESLMEIMSNADLTIFEEDEYEKVLYILESIVSKIPCYNLFFSLTSDVWDRIPSTL